MATAGSIVVDLLMRTGAFETDAKRAEKALQRFQTRAVAVGNAIGNALYDGARRAASAIYDMTQGTINAMDELSKAAQRSNVATEEFSKLAYAGGLADVAIQDLQSSLGRLAKAQADAEKSTSVQGKIFDALGISTKNAEGSLRSTYDVFLDFADAFQEYRGSPEIVAAGLNIFGRSFQNLIPLIKDGSEGLKAAGIEAEQLGLVLSTETGQQAEAFNDNLTRLKSSVQGMWMEVAQQLLPQLVELTDQFVDAAKEGDVMKETADNIVIGLRAVADTAVLFAGLIEQLGKVREMLVGIEDFVARAHFASWTGIGDKVRQALPEWMYKELGAPSSGPSFGNVVSGADTLSEDTFGLNAPNARALKLAEERRRKLAGITGAFGDTPKAGGKSKEQQEAEQLQKSYESLMETMRERIALFNTEGEAAKVRYDLEHGALKMLDEASKQALITEAERYDALVKRREADQAAYDLAKEETDRLAEQKKSAEDMLSVLQDEINLIGMSADQQEIWNNLKWAGVEADSALGKQIIESTEALQRQRDAMSDQIEAMDGIRDSFKGFWQDIRDGEGLVDSLKSAFDRLNDVLFEIALRNISDSLFGKQGDPAGGATEGFFSTLLGALFGGAKAGGGDILGNRAYLVGEQGPEMFVPRTAGTILTAPQTADAMGGGKRGMVVNQNFINPVLADRRSDTQREAEAARRLRRVQRYA